MNPRRGVSDYLATFVLIGVAAGGSVLVYGAATSLASSAGGPSVGLFGGSVMQGAYFATETIGVSNSGDSPITDFTISTPQGPQGAEYCYVLLDPGSLAREGGSCPSMASGPGSVSIQYSLQPGASLLVEILVAGEGFTLGSTLQVTVTASSGGGATAALQVVPA